MRHLHQTQPLAGLWVRIAAFAFDYLIIAVYLILLTTLSLFIRRIVVKLPEAKKGFVLLPRRRIVERSFAWTARFRRLAHDFERTPETFRSLHFIAFAILMLHNFAKSIAHVL